MQAGGAFLGRVDHRRLEWGRDRQGAGRTLRKEPVTVADVGDPTVGEYEHLRADLLANAVSDAGFLIDPDSRDSTLSRQ